MAQKRLLSELQTLQKEKWVHIEVRDNDLMRWSIGLMVANPDSAFCGGYFTADMNFTNEYPYRPPTFRFLNKALYHPNIYKDGKLCISILHAPGDDEMSGEAASERWSPLQGVESVLRSVLLLLDNPEIGSPANVDASVTYRDDKAEYNRRAKEAVDKSKQDIPEGVKMPTPEDLIILPQSSIDDDDDFWNETDEDEDDFDGDSDSEDAEYDDGDDD